MHDAVLAAQERVAMPRWALAVVGGVAVLAAGHWLHGDSERDAAIAELSRDMAAIKSVAVSEARAAELVTAAQGRLEGELADVGRGVTEARAALADLRVLVAEWAAVTREVRDELRRRTSARAEGPGIRQVLPPGGAGQVSPAGTIGVMD